MNLTVFDVKKGVFQVGIGELTQRLAKDNFFWLDIDGASAAEIQSVAAALTIPEPTSSWLSRFGQRARFEMDREHIRISTFVLGDAGLPIEPHILFTRSWVLTVHSGAGTSMDRARATCRALIGLGDFNLAAVVFIILNELIASFDPLLDHTDELLGELEDQVLRAPKAAQLQQLSGLRKQMWSLHRLWEPQYEKIRDFALAIGVLPDMAEQAQNLHDYQERITDLMDKINDIRQRANDAMESYGTSVTNMQSQVINRLTIIAAVFLPLTFLTGFFGMNFQWMMSRLVSLASFIILGIILFLAVSVCTLLLFKRKGWLGEGQVRKPGA
jgi:magnesium transporter